MREAKRVEYERTSLDRADLNINPIEQFKKWWQEAIKADEPLFDAMHLATIDQNGYPDSRMVLLKGIDDEGLLFFTNYNSSKGSQLEKNPHLSLTLYWHKEERQVRVLGRAVKCSREESEAYFKTRPRGSQLAAWASLQSEVIESREVLAKAFQMAEERFLSLEVPCPPHWGGFRVLPKRFEFWQGRKNRLHDRFRYSLDDQGWVIERLAP